MRKLKLQMQLSIDGFVAGPNGEMDWMVWNWDEQLKQYVTNITEPVDTIILGRVLAEGFIPHWASAAISPETAEPGAQKMNETTKVVFSKTLQSHDWKNTRLATGNLVEEINALKKQEGNDIIAYGGGSFVSNLIKEGLIDDYYLFINPSILGSGMPIFQEVHTRTNLKIMESKSFPCGITALHYQSI